MATIVTTKDTGNSALRIGALIALTVFVVLLNLVPITENDFWLQMKIGGMIWNDGSIPKTVLFTFTPARDNVFNAHEWLPSVLFYLLHRSIGMEQLSFVQCALGLTQFGLCALVVKRLSGSTAAALMLSAIAMAVANYHYRLRPGLFALLLLMVLFDVLYRYQLTKRWKVLLWTLPLGMLWVNSHGSFILGPVVAGIFAVGEGLDVMCQSTNANWRQRSEVAFRAALPYLLTTVALLVVSLINPMGWNLFRFVFDLSGSNAPRIYISEWMPTLSAEFMSTLEFRLFLASLLLSMAIAWWCRRKLSWTDVLLLAAFTILALYARRFLELFGFAAAVVSARLVGTHSSLGNLEKPLLALALATGIGATALTLRFGNVYGAYFYSRPPLFFTQPMIEALAKPEIQGPIYNSYALGAELVYRFYPKLQPTIDSRCDSYGSAYLETFERSLRDPVLLSAFVNAYNIRFMLLLRNDAVLLEAMPGFKNYWRLRFGDQKMVLLERVGEATTALSTPQRMDAKNQ